VWAEQPQYVGKVLHIERGEALSLQYHERKDESIFVLSGVLDLEVGDATGPLETVRLEAGEGFHIPPALRHRMTAVETCDVLEASTADLDDIIRIDDRYGRTGRRDP
jgi:mannose-6-phosphate isomerase-like protein (cupin superfamily)